MLGTSKIEFANRKVTSLNPRFTIDILLRDWYSLRWRCGVIFPSSVTRSREKVHRMHYASRQRTNGHRLKISRREPHYVPKKLDKIALIGYKKIIWNDIVEFQENITHSMIKKFCRMYFILYYNVWNFFLIERKRKRETVPFPPSRLSHFIFITLFTICM